ncbi:MAG: hypothetical protein AAGE59_13065 [Cyanobacteria bacterium P01_F01_bin.86]
MTLPNNSKSRSRSDVAADRKARQFQQYLHRPGFVPASTHPFIKQASLVQRHPKRCLAMQRLIGGGVDLVRAGLKTGFWAILIGLQIIVSPVVWLLNHH